MQRTSIYLNDEQQRRLQARARQQGVSASEIVRRILDSEFGTPSSPCAEAAAEGLWSGCTAAELAALQQWLAVDQFEGLGP